jgi:hypothetical protein
MATPATNPMAELHTACAIGNADERADGAFTAVRLYRIGSIGTVRFGLGNGAPPTTL